jgi:hypothetical protein
MLVAYLLVVLAMTFLETWLVYPVPPVGFGDWNPAGLGHEEVWFAADDGTKLYGWFVPHAEPKRWLLYCHGNGEHVAWNADLVAELRDTATARAGRMSRVASPTAWPPNAGWRSGRASRPVKLSSWADRSAPRWRSPSPPARVRRHWSWRTPSRG